MLEMELEAEQDVAFVERQAAELKSDILYTTGSKLVHDLRQMVNNPECSDVTFICRDGERIQASRMFLLTRCSVLKSMLSNGMMESTLKELVLPQVSSDVFLFVLKFLYTGEVWEEDMKFSVVSYQQDESDDDDEQNEDVIRISPFSLDWSFMFEVMRAAKFLLLDQLELVMIGRLWRDVPRDIVHTVETLREVTEKLTTVCNFDAEMRAGATGKLINVLGLLLVKIMSEHGLSVSHLRNLSEESMRYYLHNTQNFCEDEPWSSSFTEYVKLWQLTTYCTSWNEVNSACEESSTLCLAEPVRVALMVIGSEEKKKQISMELSSQMDELREKFAAAIQRETFEKLKKMINLVCIHPEILIVVVETSGVFSTKEVDVALRNQLVKASRWRDQIQNHDRKCQWLVGETDSAHLVPDYVLPSDKLAVGNVTMRCHCVYEWTIVQTFEDIRRRNVSGGVYGKDFSLEVGFLTWETGNVIRNSRLSQSRKGWAIKIEKTEEAFVQLLPSFIEEKVRFTFFACSRKIEEKTFSQYRPISQKWTSAENWVSVRLKLDRIQKIITFVYKGGEYEWVCEDLPTGLLCPAVHVSYEAYARTGETRIELHHGFQLSE